MYKEKNVAVIVPCYNEETQILRVFETMPNYVDFIVTINDHSTDKTVEVIESCIKTDPALALT